MSDKPIWIAGETYTYAEISPYTFPECRRWYVPPDDMLFTRCEPEDGGPGYFEELIESENPLIDSMQAQLAVEAMRASGMTHRQIARASGVSIEAVHRAGSGVGNVRQSTETALVRVAASLNGRSNGKVRSMYETAP